LQPRGDVNAVAEDVLPVDHDVAEVDADPPTHLAVVGKLGVERRDRLLHLGRALNGLDRTGKLAQDAVAGGAGDAAAMLRHGAVDYIASLAEPLKRSDFIGAHPTAIVLDVGAQDRGELALEAL